MAVTPYEQRSYPGAAPDTVLSGQITAAALGFVVATGTGTGFPDGTAGPFFVVIDYDNTNTEKMHCTARTGDNFTVDVRGADGTVALLHADQAKVRACWTATDAAEANAAAHQTVGAVTAKGDILSGSASHTLAKTTAGPDQDVLVADSTQTAGVRWSNTLIGIALNGGAINGFTTLVGRTATSVLAALDAATAAITAETTRAEAAETVIDATLTKIGTPISGSNTADTSAANTTLFSTSALGVGTWIVTVIVSVAMNSGTASLKVTAPSGTTITGRTSGTYNAGTSVTLDGVLSFVAVVASGTGVLAVGSGSSMTGGSHLGNGVTNGYTAHQVA